jgi:catechol 2,3-dioxygenase-like lactoylglutathione lyase family enzyme
MAFAHLTLAARDVRRSVAFYEATLGWKAIPRPGNIGMPAAWLEIAPGQELHLVEVPDFEASRFDREFGRHVAVSFPEAGFAGLRRRLEERGAELIDAIRPTPFARFFFRDPDGYIFEVVAADRPSET